MGLPSNNPLPILPRVRPGQAVRADDHNRMVDAIRILAERGIPMPLSAGGTSCPLLPFEITVAADTLKAAPGTIDGDSIAETTEASPANGTWYLEAKVTIDNTTGEITATAMDWVNAETADTSTEFHLSVGTVLVSGGVPGTITQSNYGPLLVYSYGAINDKWAAAIF